MKTLLAGIILLASVIYQQPALLTGTYEFKGGIYNGKKDPAPTEYALQRKYTTGTFNAYLLEKGEKPLKYQSGNYQVKADSCFETETFSAQPSKLTGQTLKYHYTLHLDTLILQGTLPNGTTVIEYWKKAK